MNAYFPAELPARFSTAFLAQFPTRFPAIFPTAFFKEFPARFDGSYVKMGRELVSEMHF